MYEKLFFYPDSADLTVVVRAAGERTEGACIEILRRQLPDPAQLFVVHEKPFSAAVVRTFEIGIVSGRRWLIAVDADILLLDDAIDRVREICGKMDPKAFCATPLFLCRTIGGFAMRGLHCYRASLLEEALGLTPDLPADLRPESRYHDAMCARGYTREVYAKALGIHEYEQSYRHIYLKSMLRARKDEFAGRIRERLEGVAGCQADALVALWGFEDADDDQCGLMEYDWDAPLPRFDERLALSGMTEKPPLDSDAVSGLALRELLAHPFREDMNTDGWIREMLGFADGAPGFRSQVQSPPLFTPGRRGVD